MRGASRRRSRARSASWARRPAPGAPVGAAGGRAGGAGGLGRAVRTAFPKGAYRYSHVPMCTWSTGDVFARAYVRWLEIQNSIRFIREELQELPAGALQVSVPALMPRGIVVSLVEGWRGEICHVAITDE